VQSPPSLHQTTGRQVTVTVPHPARESPTTSIIPTLQLGVLVVVYYCRTYVKAAGGGVKRGDVCYGMLRAAACVDESVPRFTQR